MTAKKQIYKCNICGNIVEVLFAGGGELVCCGAPMELEVEKNKDEGNEKHVPIIEETDDAIIVRVGSIPHPMEEAHHIEWIEVMTDTGYCRKFKVAGEEPVMEIKKCGKKIIAARAYCNIHGLWKSNS
jgi:superoxide reductase